MHGFNFQYRGDIDQSCFLRFNVMATSIGLFSENSLQALETALLVVVVADAYIFIVCLVLYNSVYAMW
jgi:hypothetical protein